MQVTTNVSRSASSILELFKFVTSLALVTGVSVWLGLIGNGNSVIQVPALNVSLVFAGFVLVLVRYYHGNSLHLLEKYSEGTPSRRLDVALPVDSFFILVQGLIIAALSFAIRNAEFFSVLLLSLLVMDVIWAGTLLRLDDELHSRYLRAWFLINLIGALVLILLHVSPISADKELLPVYLFGFILAQTFADYWSAWRRYFPTPEEKRLMIGAPFTGKIVAGQWGDSELMECIMRAFYLCQQSGYKVYSAHLIEGFGAKLRELTQYVINDVREVKDAAVYVALTDGSNSNGLAVELGIAAASGTEILLFVRDSAQGVTFLEELARAHGGSVQKYSNADHFIDQLTKKLRLEKGQDPGGLIKSMTNVAAIGKRQ